MSKLLPFAQSLFAALFWAVLLLGFPFVWILRDGLGPDMVKSSGLEAVKRCLATFYYGPVLALLAILALGLRLMGKENESD